jgi:hypothetical protein
MNGSAGIKCAIPDVFEPEGAQMLNANGTAPTLYVESPFKILLPGAAWLRDTAGAEDKTKTKCVPPFYFEMHDMDKHRLI